MIEFNKKLSNFNLLVEMMIFLMILKLPKNPEHTYYP
jgi:hypothetical protein